MISSILLFCIITLWGSDVESANILALYHVPCPSHQILGETLVKALVEKGHNVTMFSPFPLYNNIPNCHHFKLDNMIKKMERFGPIFKAQKKGRFITELLQFSDVVYEMTDTALNNSDLQNLINSNSNFDLILLDEFFNKAHYGLGYRFDAPIIVSSSSHAGIVNHLTGNPAPYSFVPNMVTPFSDKMSFFERFINTLSGIVGEIIIKYLALKPQEAIYKNYFKDGPELQELINNVSLVFINTQPYVTETVRPYMPNMIHIGGYHVKEPKLLPKDLQEYLDNAKDGVIFCSLGSNVKSSELPTVKLNAFLKAFSNLKQQVLWKWENDNIPNLPNNVKVAKWLPQRDILAHPNVKAFITQGGILSITEAMYSGVPLIGIPFFGDQLSNIANAVTAGYAVQIVFEELNENILLNALNEVVTNPRYHEEMIHRSKLIQDQPMKPLDTAIFWVEHILKFKTGRHLHSFAAEINIIQYLHLDVVALVFVILILLISGLSYIIKIIFSKKKFNQQKLKKH